MRGQLSTPRNLSFWLCSVEIIIHIFYCSTLVSKKKNENEKVNQKKPPMPDAVSFDKRRETGSWKLEESAFASRTEEPYSIRSCMVARINTH